MRSNALALDATSRRVLRALLQHGPLARTELAAVTGLSTGSLTRLSRPLIEAGLIREGEPSAGAFGRPSVPLELLDEGAGFLGIKIVPGALHAVVCGLRGQVHAQRTVEIPTQDPGRVVASVAELVEEWQPARDIDSIGVALAGAVDPFGTVRGVGFLGWGETRLSQMVTEATSLPCTAANDVDALTLAQHWLGAGRGVANFVTLTIGSGVGAGAVVDGTLLVGHQGFSNLVGDLWASTGRTFHEELSTEAIQAALEIEPQQSVYASALERAAELVMLAKHVWGPQRVLLTGEGVNLIAKREEDFRRAITRRTPTGFEAPEVLIEELGFADWAVGAAALAISQALRP